MKISVVDMTRIAVFTALICLASVMLKFGGDVAVPFSLLPLMIMLAGGILGSWPGTLSVTLFVLLGLLGVPVFAKAPYGGFVYILQPTFGFILAGIPAAFVVGKFLEASGKEGIIRTVVAMVLGLCVMYLIGVPYLYGIMRLVLGKPFTLWQAIKAGMLPFIGLDLLKGILAAFISRTVKQRVFSTVGKRNVWK